MKDADIVGSHLSLGDFEALDALARLEREIERLQDLTHRWNVEASRAGFAGSEYINDPELVFRRVAESRELMRRVSDRKIERLRAQRDDAWREVDRRGKEVERLRAESALIDYLRAESALIDYSPEPNYRLPDPDHELEVESAPRPNYDAEDRTDNPEVFDQGAER